MWRIAETFSIAGRGTVVVLAEPTGLPAGRVLRARLHRPDGATLDADAYPERLLHRPAGPHGGEAFLLRGIEKQEVPVGSTIELAPAARP
jgi:hypothetical protein